MTLLIWTSCAARLVSNLGVSASASIELPSGVKFNDLAPQDTSFVVTGSVRGLRAIRGQIPAVRTRELCLAVGGHAGLRLLHAPQIDVGGRQIIRCELYRHTKPLAYQSLTVRIGGLGELGDLIDACLVSRPMMYSLHCLPPRVGISADVSMDWLGGEGAAVPVSEHDLAPVSGEPPVVDVVIRESGTVGYEAVKARTVCPLSQWPTWEELVVSPHGWSSMIAEGEVTRHRFPPVDTRALTPIGLQTVPAPSDAHIGAGPDNGVSIRDGANRPVAEVQNWLGITEDTAERLRSFRMVRDEMGAHQGPVHRAHFLAQACAAGLPVVTEYPLDRITSVLLGELGSHLDNHVGADLDDSLLRERYVMDAHRLAFDHHGVHSWWDTDHKAITPRVSVLLPSRRPEGVAWGLRQMALQDYTYLQVIVGLHGFSAEDPIVREALSKYSGNVELVEVEGGKNLGQVLAALTERASGGVVAKIDDDDWYAVGHISDLVRAALFSGATVVGSGAEFIYLARPNITVRRQRQGGHTFTRRVAGGTMLVARDDLMHVGGWRPIHRAVDTGLLNAVIAAGGSVYRTSAINYVYRREDGHTWDPGLEYFLRGNIDQWQGFHPPPGPFTESSELTKMTPPSLFDSGSK